MCHANILLVLLLLPRPSSPATWQSFLTYSECVLWVMSSGKTPRYNRYSGGAAIASTATIPSSPSSPSADSGNGVRDTCRNLNHVAGLVFIALMICNVFPSQLLFYFKINFDSELFRLCIFLPCRAGWRPHSLQLSQLLELKVTHN